MKRFLLLLLVTGLVSCAGGSGTEYTLYRSGLDIPTQTHDATLRIHVATFDANEDAKYNLANCEFAQELFTANQPHYRDYRSNTVAPGSIRVRYWCEKGRYKR